MTAASTISSTLPAPASRTETLLRQGGLAVGASLFVAAAAHLSMPLWFTPVPLTLSDLAVLMVGLALGPSTAFAALLLYLAEGASGMPVFSPAGPGGMAQLLGPTGGFLLSYPLAAAATSWLSLTLRTRYGAFFSGNLLATIAGSSLLMICGVIWLGVWAHLTPAVAFSKGALPFIPGQVIKVLAAAGIWTSLRSWRKN